MRRTRGFTLVELMVVVAIFSVVSAIALASWHKGGTQRDVDRWAGVCREAVMQASRRAISTGKEYMVDLQSLSIAWCEVDATKVFGPPWTTTQVTCPTSGTALDRSGVIAAPSDAKVSYYATSADTNMPGSTYAAAAKLVIGSGTAVYLGRNGTASRTFANVRSSAVPTAGFGFTIYVARTALDEIAKRRRVVVYGPSSKARIIDNY